MIHVHNSIGGIAIGTGSIRPDTPVALADPGKDAPKKERKAYKKAAAALAQAGGVTREPSHDTERTWAFSGPKPLEDRLLADVEFSATHAAGVPLTVDEEKERVDLESEARVESAQVARAMADVARERLVDAKAGAGRSKAKA